MSTILAQANPAATGASDAADFQPPTGNPQIVPGQLFPGAPDLQTQTTEEILQNRDATILVPTSSPGGTQEVAVVRTNNWVVPFAVFVVCACVFFVVWRRRN